MTATDKLNRKIESALCRVAPLNIEVALTRDTYRNIATAGFDCRTLPACFVLAQVLIDNQPITVRGSFYRAVHTGIYPDNADKHYRQVGRLILKLRREGIIPYDWIADSTRTRTKPSSWSGLQDYADTVRDCYRKDFWADQHDYVEVCVEKDAMAGVLRPITREYDVYLNVIRGDCSETFIWNWAESLREIKKPISIYYLGDHDPAGLNIEQDLRRRLEGFLDRPVKWERLAVTDQDFSRSDLLGFPIRESTRKAKACKRRCEDYISRFGDRCMEVDAIAPTEIRQRLREAIESHIDQDAWDRLKQVEDMERSTIKQSLVLAPNLHGGTTV
jgi:hypothetical protein